MNAPDVSVLGEDASLVGRISGQDLTILGTFEGDLTLTGKLHLGPQAKVKASVRAASVDVQGRFDGEIRTKSLSFAPSARARGLFLADRLGISEGAIVEGSFNLVTETDARPAPKAKETKVEAKVESKPEPKVEPQSEVRTDAKAETPAAVPPAAA